MSAKVFKKTWFLNVLLIAAMPYVQAEDPMEEIVVTGSFILGAPEDAALPVDVLSRTDIDDIGRPTIVELVRRLPYTSGNFGEADPFLGRPGDIATFNMRGLGFNRSLVLVNGYRSLTEINSMPRIAIGRIEVLKEGASTIYGSDAIGGVINFITRNEFDGLELAASVQDVDGSSGEYNLSALYGLQRDNVRLLVALEYDRRNVLEIREKDWALLPLSENPQGGWSSIGNPGLAVPAVGPSRSMIIGGPRPDPQCENLGGALSGPFCAFQYTFFVNMIEETRRSNAFSRLEIDLNSDAQLHFEGNYTLVELPNRRGPPSFPPQSLITPSRFVPADHPGLIDFKVQNPTLFPDVGPFPSEIQGAFTGTRPFGVSGLNGRAGTGAREVESFSFSAGLDGSLNEGRVSFRSNWAMHHLAIFSSQSDTYVERMGFALDGLGGPDCDPATGSPGTGPCQYYNPFSNAIRQSIVNGVVNPQYNPGVANSPELSRWLITEVWDEFTADLVVFDLVFSGETQISLKGGTIGWASGVQARLLDIEREVADLSNRAINPCPFRDPFSITLGHTSSLECDQQTGLFSFLTAQNETSHSLDIYAAFVELALPITERFNMLAALRYEYYDDSSVDATLDPKIAFRWQLNDWLTFRGSASSTFRSPGPSDLTGSRTTNEFIPAAGAVKALEVLGNPDLEPEDALATNLGILVQTSNFHGSIDWWRYDIDGPLYATSANQIVQAYTINECSDGGSGVGSPTCDVLRTHVLPTGTTAANLERVVVSVVNGSYEILSGVDLVAQYDFHDVAQGTLSLGVAVTYTHKYLFGDVIENNGVKLAEGGDFAGYLNDGDPATPMPKLKGNMYMTYHRNRHHAGMYLYYTDSYKDVRPSIPSLADIDHHVTLDLHYTLELKDSLSVTLSVTNLSDEVPPQTSTDINYDSFSHSPFGRMIKLGIVYRLEI